MEKTRIDPLIGAIAGDIIGSVYEFNGITESSFQLFDSHCHYTDDTVLTVAVADWLSSPESKLDVLLASYANTYNWVGYGGMFLIWSHSHSRKPYNSFGNGSAMRVSPVGCFADTIESAMHLAEESAAPTHNHPEGIKGAQAIAVAVVLARQGKTKEEIKLKLQELFDYDLNRSYADLLADGYEFHVTCQRTVPAALISFFESEGYEDCIKKAILTNKDTDTAAAVAGAVAGAYYGVPDKIKENALGRLPKQLLDRIKLFENHLCKNGN